MSKVFAIPFVLALLVAGEALAQERGGRPARPGPAAEPEPTSRPIRTDGPLRLEADAVLEQRVSLLGTGDRAPRTGLRIRLRLVGEGITEVVRLGRPILQELIDDTGKALFDPATITDEMRQATAPASGTPAELATGIPVPVDADVSSRGAKTLKSVKGSMRVVFGGEQKSVLIQNPKQFVGGLVQHPELDRIGIKLRIVKLGEDTEDADDGRSIGIKVEGGNDAIVNMTVSDGWTRTVNSRFRDRKLKDGSTYQLRSLINQPFTDQYFLVLRVFSSVETKEVPFDLKDVPLP